MNHRTWIALGLACALVSCAKKPTAPIVVVPAAPAATSPTGAVQRLAWAMQNRDVASYTALLTDDYAFQFGPADSAGNWFPTRSLDRALEAAVAQHMLVGGGAVPPATRLQLTIGNGLADQADPRPGMDPKWHRAVLTPMELRLTIDDAGAPVVTAVSGFARLYVVRGDSANFLPDRAAARDSTRWFVTRWEDETAGVGGAPGTHADPAHTTTLGIVKLGYVATAAISR